MPRERVHQTFEKVSELSFEQLKAEWEALPEGQELHYIVANENGKPLAPNDFPNDLDEQKPALRLLVLKAEPSHDIDQDGTVTRRGIHRIAYEYVTDFKEFTSLFTGFDAEYFEKASQRKHTYIPVDDFFKALGKTDHVETSSEESDTEAVETPESTERFRDLPLSRKKAIETEKTSELYLSRTRPYLLALQSAKKNERIDDQDLWRFVRTHEARFSNLNIVDALESAEVGATFNDLKVRAGIVLTESQSTRRGKNLVGPVENAHDTAKTLIIRFLQKTKEMGPDEIVSELGDEQAQDLAAVQYEISQVEENTEFANLLRKHGFEQVRLENVSWRKRDGYGGNYQVVVPFEGNFVPPEKV